MKTESLRRGRGEPEWLLPNEDAHPMDESRVRKMFKRAQLPESRVYDLPHTYASLLTAAGAPITYVSTQLGHANPRTTPRCYARWIPSQRRRWVEVLDRADWRLEDELGSKLGTRIWNQSEIGEPRATELPDLFGGPSRTRTLENL